MKIKHFSGYGCVTAKKISKTVENGVATLIIEVSGNHERGLEYEYAIEYNIFNWLLKKFDKTVKDYHQIISFNMDSDWQYTKCTYTIKYSI